MQTVYYHITTL